MKIATWNVERLKTDGRLPGILECIEKADTEILVLTETDSRISPDYKNCFSTPPVKEANLKLYKASENRVSVFTNYKLIREHDTYDRHTTKCVELETEFGNLIIYGTIMGIFGNREASYIPDLEKQMDDVRRLTKLGNVCVLGDYNCSFSDNYYYTRQGRETVLKTFGECRISIVTEGQPECIDHIAMTDGFIGKRRIEVTEWNLDKTLSDHKGIMAELI